MKYLGLTAKSSLSSGTWNLALQELLFGVEQNLLLSTDDHDALPGLSGQWVTVCRGHRHLEGDLFRIVV